MLPDGLRAHGTAEAAEACRQAWADERVRERAKLYGSPAAPPRPNKTREKKGVDTLKDLQLGVEMIPNEMEFKKVVAELKAEGMTVDPVKIRVQVSLANAVPNTGREPDAGG